MSQQASPGVVIGVDGGGSQCRVAVADLTGRELARATGGACNVFTDRQGAARAIAQTAREALQQAGLDSRVVDQVPAFLGLAGLNLETDETELTAALPFATSRFASDGEIALQGALGGTDGVIAIHGTGSVYFARQAGEVRSIGGWGLALGDHGSGAAVGKSLMEATLLAHDGVFEHTPLSRAVMARFDDSATALVQRARGFSPRDFAAFAPLVFDAADKGDEVAVRLVEKALGDVDAALDTIVFNDCRRLCFLGGLSHRYRRLVAPRHRARIVEPEGDAVAGALQLALRMFHDVTMSPAG